MSQVRSRNTGPEMRLRTALWAAGLRYRVHPALPGRPDLAFLGPKVAVFVDGCFWHGCPIHGAIPATRSGWWEKKLAGNVVRDRAVQDELQVAGWKVLRFWEHEVKEDLSRIVHDVCIAVRGDSPE